VLTKIAPYLFAFTLFLSATLVFSVQPMIGKMMLPHVGGSPAGWVVAMFFFQVCLLVGYGLAYIFSKLTPLWNALAILSVFIPGALFLPILYKSGAHEAITPLIIFVQLALSAALPFLALSTLAPGLQRLFSFSQHKTANDPYYLYAASNVGSFTGLLAYPLIFEPLIGLSAQSYFWMVSYGVLFFCVIACALLILKTNKSVFTLKLFGKPKSETTDKTNPVSWKRRLRWLMLAAIPSSLMLGVTTEITTDIASAPMIWVIPLSLYLLTNIIAFAKRGQIKTSKLAAMHAIGVVLILVHGMANIQGESTLISLGVALLYLIIFTISAMLLHSELANDRPSTNKLTEFYLFMALGGAIGGGFNAFIAPTLFNDVYEFQAILILSLLLSPSFKDKIPRSLSKILLALPVIAAIVAAAHIGFGPFGSVPFLILAVLLFFASVNTRILFLISAIAFVFTLLNTSDYLHIHRNFFGVTKVQNHSLYADVESKARMFFHGTTLHGFQPLDEQTAHQPWGYYTANGPVGDVMNIVKPKLTAVLGLGAGQLICYNSSGTKTVSYEIDPHVEKVAREYFTYLEKCGDNEVVIGDARLAFEKDKNIYDIIFLDVFSSDSIPAHLLTVEAFDIYKSKLTDNGSIVINISNRHLDLRGPLSALADHNSDIFLTKRHHWEENKNPYDLSSEWAIITDNITLAQKLQAKNWQSFETNTKPWTDDYSNFIATMKILNINKSENHSEEK